MNRVAILGGVRTPFAKAGGALKSFSTVDLGRLLVQETLERLQVAPEIVEELQFGSVLADPFVPQLAREVVLRSSLPKKIPAHSVSSNCITGLVAATGIAEGITSGRIQAGLAGGAEVMSRPGLSVSREAHEFYYSLASARSLKDRLSTLASFRPGYFFPQFPSPKEPSTGLTMGEHCEITAKEWRISRQEQDQRALLSHQAAAKAEQEGFFSSHRVAIQNLGKDTLVRADTSLEKLSRLPPVFDKSSQGTLTAGNSSALTDGASIVLLASERRAQELQKEPLAWITGIEYAALGPEEGLLMAPVLAVPRLLHRNGLRFEDIDIFEVHEAFGAQVAANRQGWKEGWNRYPNLPLQGEIPEEKLNVNGGSIALGHPFAATGGRLILGLVHLLQEQKKKRGLISVCAAGGMACAMLVER